MTPPRSSAAARLSPSKIGRSSVATSRSKFLVVGIDPGARTTGIIARTGVELVVAELVVNDDAPLLSAGYLREVLTVLDSLQVRARQRKAELFVAVEDVTEPSPHLRIISLRGLLGTAQVLGAVRGWADDSCEILVVRPGGHGSAPMRTYPAALVGAREKSGTGKLRHVRSAWDVASAAMAASPLLFAASPVAARTPREYAPPS